MITLYFDEAGRGPLAGPVSVGISLKLEDFDETDFNDSKQLTEKKREVLFEKIENLEKDGKIVFGIGMASNVEIDDIGIVPAIKTAIMRGVNELFDKYDGSGKDMDKESEKFLHYVKALKPKMVLDGNSDFGLGKLIETETVIKGDAKIRMIGLSSILAKVSRDRLIVKISEDFPEEYGKYGMSGHKGYGTKVHTDAIRKYGLSKLHRKTFCKNFTKQ